MINELKIIGKEADMACLDILSQNSPSEAEESNEKLLSK
jgi:hypothetical protein